MYATKNANQYDGDIIIEREGTTYIGRLMPGYSRTASDLPVEQQPIWQVERIDQIATPLPSTSQQNEEQTNEEDPEQEYIMTTRRMYPNGCEDYKFAIANYNTLTYDYRH